MSDVAIRVEGLGKRYRLGAQRQSYGSLRDSLTGLGKRLLPSGKDARAARKPEFWALKDVNFEVKRGEVLGIIGRNGAGKSTLLKLLSEITEPTEGRITMNGRVASLLEVGTGFHPELSGRENIFLNGAILGMTKVEITSKFDEIVAFAEVEKFIDTQVKHYSSGMYLRLAFAVAAHLEPEILVVDEVLAVGDAAFQKKCLGKMEAVSREGRTVLFVSHSLPAVRSLCSRGLLLAQGMLRADGSVATTIEAYQAGVRQNAYVKEFGSLEAAPTNGIAVVRSVAAVNQAGDVTRELNIDEDFYLQIVYDIISDGTSAGVTLILYDADHYCIFSSICNTDENWYARPMPAGQYISRCKIPGCLLNSGRHFVSFNIFTKGFTESTSIQDVLVLDMSDGATVRRDYQGPYSGAVRPLLAWSTVRVE